jgi:hypothetical protein
MTTHDHQTEATPSPEEVEPAAPGTETLTERAASSTVSADPLDRANGIDHPRGPAIGRGRRGAEPSPTVGRPPRTVKCPTLIGDRGHGGAA